METPYHDSDNLDDSRQPWRGDQHLEEEFFEDWPEDQAGPEHRM